MTPFSDRDASMDKCGSDGIRCARRELLNSLRVQVEASAMPNSIRGGNGGVEARLEAGGFKLSGGELTIRHFDSDARFPVPAGVRLVSSPLLGPTGDPVSLVDRGNDPC